jgi:Mg-chelatase subunit ChlI
MKPAVRLGLALIFLAVAVCAAARAQSNSASRSDYARAARNNKEHQTRTGKSHTPPKTSHLRLRSASSAHLRNRRRASPIKPRRTHTRHPPRSRRRLSVARTERSGKRHVRRGSRSRRSAQQRQKVDQFARDFDKATNPISTTALRLAPYRIAATRGQLLCSISG